MTTRHESGSWLMWCDWCGQHALPERDRERQMTAARAAGWKSTDRGDCCPRCRPIVFLELPRVEDHGRDCTPEEVRQIERELTEREEW